MRTYDWGARVGAAGVVAVTAALAALAGCGGGTSIDPALELLPADTEAVAVVDLAVARKSGVWKELAEPVFRLLSDPKAAEAKVEDAGEKKGDAAARKKSAKKKAKLSGPLASLEELLDDVADAGNVDLAADLEALVVGLPESDDPPLLVVLGRHFSDKGLEAVLDARDIDYDSDRAKGLRFHVIGETAIAVLDERTLVAGAVDAVESAIGRFVGGDAKSAADSDRLRAALRDVERPAAAYVFGVPTDDQLDALEDAGFEGAEAAKSFAAWVRVDPATDLFHVAVAGRAADAEKGAALASDLESALGKARKRLREVPRPFARVMKEPAVVAKGAQVILSLELEAVRFLREVEDDAAAAELARTFAGTLLGGSGGGAGLAVLPGGELDAAGVTALVGPLAPLSELVVVADVAALRGSGLPGSAAALRDALRGSVSDTSELDRFVAATGFDPLRDVSAAAFAVEKVSLYGDRPEWLAVLRASGFDLEKLHAWLAAEGRGPARETSTGGLPVVTWAGEAASIGSGGLVLVGTRAHVLAAADGARRGEGLAASLPPVKAIAGVYSGHVDPSWASLIRPGLSTSGVTAVAFSAGTEDGSWHGRAWLRGDAERMRETCDSVARAIGEVGGAAVLARLKASMDGSSCLTEASVPASLLSSFASPTSPAIASMLAALLGGLGSAPPDPWAPPPPPPPPSGSMAEMASKAMTDPSVGSRARPILVTAIDQEYEFLRLMTCGAGGTFTAMAQRLVSEAGRSLDEVEAVCSSGSEKRTFYFDVTSIFGTGAF